jgi:hypothetical protein
MAGGMFHLAFPVRVRETDNIPFLNIFKNIYATLKFLKCGAGNETY